MSENINMCIYSRLAFEGMFDIGVLKTETNEIFWKITPEISKTLPATQTTDV